MSDVNEMYNQAEKLKDEGKDEEAIALLQKLLESEPNHVLSHLALAVLYGKINQHEKAVESGQCACDLDPTDAFNFTALSVTCQRAWQGTQRQEYIHAAEAAMERAHAIQGQG